MLVLFEFRAVARLAALVIGIVLVPTASHARGYDDYLQQIETEARQLALNPRSAKANSLPDASGSTLLMMHLDAERLPLNLRRENFERMLEQQFLGTYTFYQRLSVEDKDQVFRRYQQDNRISTIREETLKHL